MPRSCRLPPPLRIRSLFEAEGPVGVTMSLMLAGVPLRNPPGLGLAMDEGADTEMGLGLPGIPMGGRLALGPNGGCGTAGAPAIWAIREG